MVIDATNRKWAIGAVVQGEQMVFGPFDTKLTADRMVTALRKAGVEARDPQHMYTVGTAKALVSAAARGLLTQPTQVADVIAPVRQQIGAVRRELEVVVAKMVEQPREIEPPKKKSVWRRMTEM